MDEIQKIQQSIGRITKNAFDQSVCAKLVSLLKKYKADNDLPSVLLFPVCANANFEAFIYLAGRMRIDNASELISHTVTFRQINENLQLNQVKILDELFKYVPQEERKNTASLALVRAVWFGEYHAVRCLIEKHGADVHYQSAGRGMAELVQNAVLKFGDTKTQAYLESVLISKT